MGKRTNNLIVEESGDVANGRVSVSLGREPLWRVGVDALDRQMSRIREYAVVVADESDAEDIHQMRVATRRLRTMARLLEATPVFRRKRVNRLRKQLQPLADHLGAVRDLDILLEHLGEYERANGATSESDESSEPEERHSPLRDDLLQRREKALTRLRQMIRRPATQRMPQDPRNAMDRLVVRTQKARQVLVRHVAGSALWEHYEAILSFEIAIAAVAAPEQLHALRIACKQLRYALELFSLESDNSAQSLLSTLKGVQTHLGDLQDSVFTIALLARLRKDHPDDAQLSGFRAAQESQRDTLLQSFTPFWERISGAPYRKKLAALIAAL